SSPDSRPAHPAIGRGLPASDWSAPSSPCSVVRGLRGRPWDPHLLLNSMRRRRIFSRFLLLFGRLLNIFWSLGWLGDFAFAASHRGDATIEGSTAFITAAVHRSRRGGAEG